MSGEISSELNIPHSTVFALCKEMDDEGMAFTVDHRNEISKIDGFYQCEAVISHAGKHLVYRGGYKWKSIKNFIIDFPKTFWWVIAIFTFMVGRDFKCSSKKEFTQQVQQSQQVLHIVRDTCLNKN